MSSSCCFKTLLEESFPLLKPKKANRNIIQNSICIGVLIITTKVLRADPVRSLALDTSLETKVKGKYFTAILKRKVALGLGGVVVDSFILIRRLVF